MPQTTTVAKIIDVQESSSPKPVRRPRAKPGTAVQAVSGESKAVATVQEQSGLVAMLQKVMTDPTVSLERVNQAFEFYQKVQASEAKKAFDAAMADARAEFEPVVKRNAVDYENKDRTRTGYKHESLADISAVVDPILSKYGLSYRYRATSKPSEPVTVTCIVTHRLGFAEENTLSAGADNSGGKNTIQAIGSTLTYLQRYTLRLSLGLATARDDDGKTSEQGNDEFVTEEQLAHLMTRIGNEGVNIEMLCKHLKIPNLPALPQRRFDDVKKLLDERLKKRI